MTLPTRDRLPDGRRYVTVSQAALALGLPERTLRSWCEAGRLPYRQRAPRTPRLVAITTLNNLESDGWAVDWLTLEDK
ncbi:MAG: helix-turn-helix domain-containing protein [Fimbriimonadaceae bacterium]|nr:helix-turn-helix domain-containing protein [Fimbriimonadaceae bacterium]